MAGRRRGRGSKSRKNKATDSINHLSKLIVELDKEISDVAARDLLRVSKRHGVRPERNIREIICRSCNTILRPGENTRVRIQDGIRRLTCLDCGRVHRRNINKVKVP